MGSGASSNKTIETATSQAVNSKSTESAQPKQSVLAESTQSKNAFIDEFGAVDGGQIGISPGKLKKMALGQQGYFDQQRDYDSTLAKVEFNHTSAIEWTQPSGSPAAPFKSSAVNTPLKESKEFARGSFASPNARNNPNSSNVGSSKSPAPNKRMNSDELGPTVRQSGTASHGASSNQIVKPINGVASTVNQPRPPPYLRESDGPSNPQQPSSPAREENFDSRKTVTQFSFPDTAYTTGGSNASFSNHNASGGNLHNGLISRPFPGQSTAPFSQKYDRDDDMIGVFGTLTLTPAEREGLKRPESVPILSLSGNASIQQQQLQNSLSPPVAAGPPPRGVSRPSAPHPSTLKGVNSLPVNSPPPVASSVPKVTYAQGTAGPRGVPSVSISHTSPAPTPSAAQLAQRAISSQYAAAVQQTGSHTGVPNGRPGVMAPQVKETKDVKRNRVQMPNTLMHAKPTTGDWLNKRYIVNDYILLDILGTGSYGEVRMCKHRTSDRLYAIKIISKDFLKKKKGGKSSSETYFEDIKREIAIMKKLSHPNVLRLFEVLDDPNVNKMYLVLEYMKQGDLINILKLRAKSDGTSASEGQGFCPLHDFDVWDIFKQLNAGVKYLHRQNIVHGDIKPQNLLLDVNGIVKIADFGISQMLSQSKQEIGDAAGTPAFMSPELCEGKSFSGQKADIWAIGATIFMLRFGNPPFVAKNIINLYKKIVNDPVVYPFEIDPALKNLLENILEKDTNRRYSMNQIMSHPWFIRRPLPPRPVSVHKQVTSGGPSRASSAPSDGSRPSKRDAPAPVPYELANLVIPNNTDSSSPPPIFSFQPPDTYDAEEEAAMNAPESTVDNTEIFMSVGGIVKTSHVRVTHEGHIAEDEEEEAEPVHTDMMNTNWGDDVFEMVDDGGLGSYDDGGDDDDEVSVKVSAKKKPKLLGKHEQKEKSAFETNVDDIDIDSDDDESVDGVSVKKSKAIPPSGKIKGKHEVPQPSGLDAMESIGDISVQSREMTQEEEDRRAKRFIKTNVAKKITDPVVYDSSANSSDNAISANNSKQTLELPKGNNFPVTTPSGKNITRPTPLQTLQMKNSHGVLVHGGGGSQASSLANSPTRSRKASMFDDDCEALDELDMDQFNNMMDTLAQQPRLPKDKLNFDEVDEEAPSFNQTSINLEGIESQLFNNFSSIVAAFHSEQGGRHTQEDRCILLPNVAVAKHAFEVHLDPFAMSTLQHFTIACIFDGHSGWRTSQYLSQHFVPLLISNEKFYNSKTVETAVMETFSTVDANVCSMLRNEEDGSGSTGVVAIYDGRKHRFTVAGVGDSMCVISRGGRAVVVNKMHRLTDNPPEKDRIEKAGGSVINARVNGILAVSRAFGDTQFKEFEEDKTAINEKSLVIAVPSISTEIITPKTEFCILASDGLWDVMSPQVAVSYVVNKLSKNGDLQKAAKELCLEGISRGSIDNITVLILAFHSTGSGQNKNIGVPSNSRNGSHNEHKK